MMDGTTEHALTAMYTPTILLKIKRYPIKTSEKILTHENSAV